MQEHHQQRNISGPAASVHTPFHMNLAVCKSNKAFFTANISIPTLEELENPLTGWSQQELPVNSTLHTMPKARSNSSD